VVRSLESLDVARVIAGSGAVSIVAYQLSKALRTVWIERSKRKTMLAIVNKLIALEPDQAERLQARLDRVRPPPPDQIEPPAAS
jgi:NADPH:quinone reductase-like Zn-dependent oxidoreductase